MKKALKIIGLSAGILIGGVLLLWIARFGILMIILSQVDDNLTEKEIIALVEGNEPLLREVSAELSEMGYMGRINDENRAEFSDTIEKVLKIKGLQYISVEENGRIEFYCGGSGLPPASQYYGFYYTAADEPENFMSTEPLTKDGKDRWIWQESGSDNTFRTRRITDNFYFYVMSF